MSIVFAISAPSGTGKSTLTRALLASEEGVEYGVSVTTRPPRGHEMDGRDYWFVSREIFDEMRRRGEFLESAVVYGHCYGTPTVALERARARRNDLLLDIDVQGASSLRKKLPDAVTVFVLPPSATRLERRLRKRSSDEDAVIDGRLAAASREVREYRSYDYVVINDDLADSVSEIRAILLAERRKRDRMERAIAGILNDFGIRADAIAEASE